MINEMGLSQMSYETLITAYQNAVRLELNQEFLQLLKDEIERRQTLEESDPFPSL
ncbi:sporulation histidine kinase inhibitor Sda [Paenibacillus sp. YPG26]|uniref:sporulation histidine kinase inhibitor Sda n=1 Tax=Paenibacillus sp. YPG26 TaxID=2878915 RepID=UPI00203F4C2B|nr:sporulation histidine kinase inhibitor Sda [Paenibacillus sp. YPG26]USB32499.1 sporulation histidine kinase inhibitor Sda [Paenibacillus sp. YPG26]